MYDNQLGLIDFFFYLSQVDPSLNYCRGQSKPKLHTHP